MNSSISQRTGKLSGDLSEDFSGSKAVNETKRDDRHAVFSEQVRAAEPLRGGAVFRWESTTAGILILAALGTVAAPPTVTRHLVTLAQLSMLAKPSLLVGYRGRDRLRHYFTLPAKQPCSLPLAEWSVTAMPVELGFCIPLVFQGTRLTIPPPEWSLTIELDSLQWAID